MPVAIECYYFYPHDAAMRRARAGDPNFQLVERFAKQAPKEAWDGREGQSSQGIYLMGPQGEFLGGRPGFVEPNIILGQMRGAVEKWRTVRTANNYANAPIPAVGLNPPGDAAGQPMILKVAVRDLPRWKGDQRGERLENIDLPNPLSNPRRWAWNAGWVGFSNPADWVTDSTIEVAVAEYSAKHFAKRALIDSVHGQAPYWDNAHVRAVRLTKKRTAATGDRVTLVYQGEIDLKANSVTYRPKVYGEAVWNRSLRRFESFELVAIGNRSGGWPLSRETPDHGAAPMGVAVTLFRSR